MGDSSTVFSLSMDEYPSDLDVQLGVVLIFSDVKMQPRITSNMKAAEI